MAISHHRWPRVNRGSGGTARSFQPPSRARTEDTGRQPTPTRRQPRPLGGGWRGLVRAVEIGLVLWSMVMWAVMAHLLRKPGTMLQLHRSRSEGRTTLAQA